MPQLRRHTSGWAFLLLAFILCPRAEAADSRAISSIEPSGDLSLSAYGNLPAVKAQLRYFLGPGRRSIERAISRSTPYLTMIQENLRREGLPSELAWLPLIESGFSSAALSPAGAAGMWQFMPATARAYGLRVDRYIDERRDVDKATLAAVRHLRDLRDRYGSSFLAAAAYNAGAGRIDRGLGFLEISDAQDKDFFRLSKASLLSAETRDYVPRLIAAALIAENPGRYGLRPADRSSLVRHSTRPYRMAQARWLAPARWRTAFPHGRPDAALAREARPAERHRRALVEEGDTMASLAASHGVTVEALCRVNMLPAGQVLRPGRVLLLPRATDVAAGGPGGGPVPD
jgi:membrane-bound lytic murein transglycosylase D